MWRFVAVGLCLSAIGCTSGLETQSVDSKPVTPASTPTENETPDEPDTLPPRESDDDDDAPVNNNDEGEENDADPEDAEDLDDTTPPETDTTGPAIPSCGAPDAYLFDVVIEEVVLLPYAAPGTPWDWDGDVPDWLVSDSEWLADVLADSDVGDGWVSAADYAAALLALTDDWAGSLLGGTIPPDPYVEMYAHDGTQLTWDFGVTDTEDNQISGIYYQTFEDVYLLEGESLYLMGWDEDLLVDDFVNGWALTEQDLKEFADCGSLMLSSGDPTDPLQAMYIEIRAIE